MTPGYNFIETYHTTLGMDHQRGDGIQYIMLHENIYRNMHVILVICAIIEQPIALISILYHSLIHIAR